MSAVYYLHAHGAYSTYPGWVHIFPELRSITTCSNILIYGPYLPPGFIIIILVDGPYLPVYGPLYTYMVNVHMIMSIYTTSDHLWSSAIVCLSLFYIPTLSAYRHGQGYGPRVPAHNPHLPTCLDISYLISIVNACLSIFHMLLSIYSAYKEYGP